MKRRGLQSTSLRLLGLFLLSTGLPALAEPAAPAQTATRSITPELEVRELRPGILIFTHSFPYPANMVLVEMQNRDLVLVDTTYTPEAAGELLAWIEQRFGKRRLIAVNTHFHVDRIGGNAALLRAGVPVYGSDRIAGLLRERGEAMRELMLKSSEDPAIKAVYRQMDFVPPDRVFPLKQGLKLSFG
ncbi:MAG: MBL fold metallo-hydrolase, partial [Candidatus Sericytochromatia bacterium]